MKPSALDAVPAGSPLRRAGRPAAPAATIEAVEARAWGDLFAAMPRALRAALQAETRVIDGALVLVCPGFDRHKFNCALGIGVLEPATSAGLDAIIDVWRAAGVTAFMLQSQPQTRPDPYQGWLGEHGLRPTSAWDRVVRGDEPLGAPLAAADGRDIAVERVDATTMEEWSGLVTRVYGLAAADVWLNALLGRPGWHHYLAREGGVAVAARSMYLDGSREAWLGIDGPVPGVMTADYTPDAALCARIVADALALGARTMVADIEAASPALDTPAYAYFAALGFAWPYTRVNHTPRPPDG